MNMYIGNLAFGVTEEELKELFSAIRRGRQHQSGQGSVFRAVQGLWFYRDAQ